MQGRYLLPTEFYVLSLRGNAITSQIKNSWLPWSTTATYKIQSRPIHTLALLAVKSQIEISFKLQERLKVTSYAAVTELEVEKVWANF